MPEPDDETAVPGAAWQRYVPLVSWVMVVATFVLIAFKIWSYNYLPAGDARRHVAQAFAHKPFTEIVVMRPEYSMDNSPGWDWLLRVLHDRAGFTKDGLMGFSVVALLLGIFLTPLVWLRRPEAWLAAVLAELVAIPELMTRLTQARPYLVTMAVCIGVLFAWSKPLNGQPTWRRVMGTSAAIGLSVWMHGTWYLWALPVLAFFLAGWWREGLSLTACWAAGTIGGALLTGQPATFLEQAVLLIGSISREHLPQWMLVGELGPHRGEFETLVLLAIVFLWRRQRGGAEAKLVSPPLVAMIALCWILGFKADRCWADWGMAAVLVWLALQFEELMKSGWAPTTGRRVLACALLAAPLYLHSTNDLDRRYTRWQDEAFMDAHDPGLQGWLPGDGGIFYTANLAFFYNTFYANPEGNWRYILGFEPALMPDEDLKIYRDIQKSGGAWPDYEPWVKKMRPADRLAIYSGVKPDLPELEWCNAGGGLWLGRLP